MASKQQLSVAVSFVIIFTILLVTLINATVLAQANNAEQTGERVSVLTDDNVSIAGTYHPSNNNSSASIILLHMLGRERGDWNNFIPVLTENGYSVLSIDLRGHGESTNQDNMNISYESFSEDDFNDMVMDVKAAKEFLLNKTADPDNISIVGASIGANVALNYAASDPKIKSVVLLSPGLNYRGVSTTEAIKQYNGPIYIAVSSGDGSADDSKVLCDEIKCGENLKIYEGSSSHGTEMFSESLDPPLEDIVISWIGKT